MDKTLSASLSSLHKTVLKPAGFSKKAATFSRVHSSHIELFNIQSSQWNGPWGRSFYVNCGLSFSDLPLEYPCSLPGAQWEDRIDKVVPDAPQSWNYAEDTIDSVRDRLGECIVLASEHFAGNLERYRELYLLRVKSILLYRQGLKA